VTGILRRERTRLWWGVFWLGLGSVAALVSVTNLNPYESAQLSLANLWQLFQGTVANLPLIALVMVWLVGLMLIRTPLKAVLKMRLPNLPTTILLVMALGAMVVWALCPFLWSYALNYRFFVIPLSTPFIVAAAMDSFRAAEPPAQWGERVQIMRYVGIIFALTTMIQAGWLFSYAQRLRVTLATSPTPCLDFNSPHTAWMRSTILDHWTITPYAILIQGRHPKKMLLREVSCQNTNFSAGVPVATWDVRGSGWFDFEGFFDHLQSSPP